MAKILTIHDEGFPDGWFVEEHSETHSVHLYADYWRGPHSRVSICQKPRSITVTDWLPIAKEIAQNLSGTQTNAANKVKDFLITRDNQLLASDGPCRDTHEGCERALREVYLMVGGQ